MSIPLTTSFYRQRLPMNGVANRFPLAQQAYEVTDFKVYVETEEGDVDLSYTTDYVIEAFARGLKATIVLNDTWEDGNVLVVENDISYGQMAEIARVGLFDGGLIEEGIDRVALTVQRSIQRTMPFELEDNIVEPRNYVADTAMQRKAQRDRIHAMAETRYGEEDVGNLASVAGAIGRLN